MKGMQPLTNDDLPAQALKLLASKPCHRMAHAEGGGCWQRLYSPGLASRFRALYYQLAKPYILGQWAS
jgi:hypothetical protein